ncbi:hypothetical protein TanjilG_30032 [Lupinus angustifolius]|uniref:ASCH domain-containing protein n=1 Tax=Lupinus angustifolius TaxID=3871 RepID=A0A4P1R6M1_LUPAN|nr:hypothetical protein TanjilG_30032 [Lupinus angustifolius]
MKKNGDGGGGGEDNESPWMRDCIDEVMKLTLQSHSHLINLSPQFCSNLLKHDPIHSPSSDSSKGVPLIELGDLILINKSVVFEVQGIRRYPTFSDMLEAEKLEKVLPGVESVEEGLEVYRRFYTEEKELANGVLAIIVSKVAFQPYIPLVNLFSGLSYEGVQGLLGLMHTTGTSPDALPPSKSTLLASFNMPCNPNVKSSSLTHGARALAKHAGRSSNGYWGSLDGSDSNKNRLAMNVINYLIGHCCWMNLHAVSPHGVVFEIRVADGYGARWTEDGSKVCEFPPNSGTYLLQLQV